MIFPKRAGPFKDEISHDLHIKWITGITRKWWVCGAIQLIRIGFCNGSCNCLTIDIACLPYRVHGKPYPFWLPEWTRFRTDLAFSPREPIQDLDQVWCPKVVQLLAQVTRFI